MRKTIMTMLLFAAVFASKQSNAQRDDDLKKLSAGFGFDFGTFTGGGLINESYETSINIWGRFGVHAGPGWVTFTPSVAVLGRFSNPLDDGEHYTLKGGYKWISPFKLFVQAEAGYGFYKITTYDPEYYYEKKTYSGLFLQPTIGANFGRLELGATYGYNKLSIGNATTVALRLGFNF